jgi:DNA-directed RNA polymerase subunit K/omega
VDAAFRATGTAAGEIEGEMTIRPPRVNAFEFVVVSALRAQQLLAGCTPRLPGLHSATTMAQMEVAGGRVARDASDAPAGTRQCGWQL